MIKKFLLSGFGVMLLLFGGIANASVVDITEVEACVNISDNGIYSVGPGCLDYPATSGDVTDAIVDGLGTVTVTVTGVGSHFVDMFVDWDLDETFNTFYNETGATGGTLAAGQSWEIDEPGYVDGDIYDNFLDSLLDNDYGTSIFGNTTFPDDVSMALGWDFTLGLDETATIMFLLADVAPGSGFWLQQDDPDSGNSVYFSSTLRIGGGGPSVPEPGTLWLMGAGLLSLGLMRRRNLTDS